MNNMSVRKTIERCFDPALFAWVAVVGIFGLILTTLHKGVSCDEGYYLMGYLQNQEIGPNSTDFHNIVKLLGKPFPDNDIMVFRYMRLLFIPALIFFSWASYRWLTSRCGLHVRYYQVAPFVFLAGAWSYTFAAPTISYDHLQTVFYLLALSFFFSHIVSGKKIHKILLSIALGFVLWFGFANYPPSGVCLIVLLFIWYLIEYRKVYWRDLLSALFGLFLAMALYHLSIHDVKDLFSVLGKTFVSVFTDKSMSRHDAGGLISSLLKVIVEFLTYLLPVLALSWLINVKVKLPKMVQVLFAIALMAVALVCRRIYKLEGVVPLIPVVWMLGKVLANSDERKSFLIASNIVPFIILLGLPIAGIFGSNQDLVTKAVMFVPFWIVAFFMLVVCSDAVDRNVEWVLVVLLFAGYVYLGNFSRYHYYYTPRSSKKELVGVVRSQRVLVSAYQQEYFKDVCELIRTKTGKDNPKYLGFGENQITGYFAGGYFNGGLVYHWWQYKYCDEERPDLFILFKNEEQDVINEFGKFPWEFPEQYERTEMRKMSENMSDDLNTVIYTIK